MQKLSGWASSKDLLRFTQRVSEFCNFGVILLFYRNILLADQSL